MSLLDVLPRLGRKDKSEDRLPAPPPPPPPPSPPVYKGVLIVPTGRFRQDLRYEWSTDDPASVQAARDTFQAMRNIGYGAFMTVDAPNGYGGTREESYNIRTFDPQAKVIQMQAQFAGG